MWQNIIIIMNIDASHCHRSFLFIEFAIPSEVDVSEIVAVIVRELGKLVESP